MASIEGRDVDRLPRDLSGMRSTGISCFAYPKLVEALGLPPRRPRIYDPSQMLALPEVDVLDALGCDCVVAEGDMTNAFPQPELWHDYDFNGRLEAQVRDPNAYATLPDGTITLGRMRMVPGSTVFNADHAGCAIDLDNDLPPPDVEAHRANAGKGGITPEAAAAIGDFYGKIRRAANGRAVFGANGFMMPGINIGMGMHTVACVMYPEEMAQIHAINVQRCLRNLRVVLPLIKDSVDILLISADDWGTQTSLVASPEVYRTLFKPYYKQVNDAIHEIAPGVKTFLHTCGAVYPLIKDFAESGFDIMNPVQWCAGDKTPAEWKAEADGKITFWGGGVNSQETLPLKSVADIQAEVRRVVPELSKGGRYVFCNIHNILSEIPPEKVIALYSAL